MGLGALAQMSKFSWTLSVKRWGCVVDFLRHVQPLLAVLRRVWIERKYASNVDGGDAEKLEADEGDGASQLNPALLTETLRSSMFWMEAARVLRLQGVVQNLGDWAECYPCHSARHAPLLASERLKWRQASCSTSSTRLGCLRRLLQWCMDCHRFARQCTHAA